MESGPKWTVQEGESGRSRESGRSVQKLTVLSKTGRSSEPKWTVRDDSGRSFEPKWTVTGQSSRLKVDGPSDESKYRSERSKNIKVDGLLNALTLSALVTQSELILTLITPSP